MAGQNYKGTEGESCLIAYDLHEMKFLTFVQPIPSIILFILDKSSH